MFSKVLIANRGEIAVRIARALRRDGGRRRGRLLGARPRRAPRQARRRGATTSATARRPENYLSIEKILDVAKRSGAEAIHPGYGFLAENAPFAQACEDAGVVFIGPPASAIEAMGSKTRARELMQAAGVPIVPGTTEPVETVADALRIAKGEIGFPVAVKAAGGGGGKGFRVALSEDELEGAFEGSSREGEKFFSDATVYLERYLHDPRHVEVQVLADRHGNVIHLGERDCSIQRRHQKVIEESPAPEWVVDPQMRERIGQIGVNAAKAVDYVGAGTIEGLFAAAEGNGARVLLPRDEHARAGRALRDRDDDGHRHRQGGHPRGGRRGTRLRAGRRRAARPRDRVPHQRRGRLEELRARAGQDRPLPRAERPRRARRLGRRGERRSLADVRPDGGQADRVGRRPRAGHGTRMLRALGEYEIEGLKTLIPFHQALLATEEWKRGSTCKDLLEDKEWLKTLAFPKDGCARRGR